MSDTSISDGEHIHVHYWYTAEIKSAFEAVTDLSEMPEQYYVRREYAYLICTKCAEARKAPVTEGNG